MFKIFMSDEQKNRRKWCPRCGKMYDFNTKLARCWDCSVGLVSYEEYKNRDMDRVEKEYQKAQDDWKKLGSAKSSKAGQSSNLSHLWQHKRREDFYRCKSWRSCYVWITQ